MIRGGLGSLVGAGKKMKIVSIILILEFQLLFPEQCSSLRIDQQWFGELAARCWTDTQLSKLSDGCLPVSCPRAMRQLEDQPTLGC